MKIKTVSILSLLAFSAATPMVTAAEAGCKSGGCCAGETATTAPVLKVIAAEGGQSVTTHEVLASQMLEGYAVVSTALYNDDLQAAQKAAVGMVKYDKDSALAKHAQLIADSKSIEEARNHFREFSDVAISIAKAEKTMHVVHCPMAMGGKGADWLQKSADEVQNPYMGAKMPHCGVMVK
jgi:hypothetical protein